MKAALQIVIALLLVVVFYQQRIISDYESEIDQLQQQVKPCPSLALPADED